MPAARCRDEAGSDAGRGSTTRRVLLLVLAAGAALRLIGIGWGLPDIDHLCSYHPDEAPLLATVAGMAERGTWNPHFFNYGTLYIYLVAVAARAMALVGLSPFEGAASLLYLTGRLVTVLFGVGTIAVVYLIGRDLGRPAIGLLAALLLAVMPLHVIHGHYATVDITATFFFALMLLACVRMLRQGQSAAGWRWPAIGAAALGLAAATKYTMAVGILPLLLALALARRRWTTYPVVIIVAGAAFLAACPYAVLDWRSFQEGVTFESRHAATLATAAFYGTGSGWRYHLLTSLPMAMGTPVLMVAAAGLIALPLRGGRVGCLLLAATGIMYAVIGYPRDHFMRYTIPLLPLLALSAAALLVGFSGRGQTRRRAAATGVSGLLVLWSLILTIAQLTFLVGAPVHDRAAAWIKINLPAGRQVAFAGWPWFYTPPITRYQCGPASERLFVAAREQWRYRFAVLDWSSSLLGRERPPYVVMADVEEMARPADRAKETERFLRALKREYEPWRSFPTRGARRVVVKALDDAPPDWRYPSPVITVYRLRQAADN